MLGEENGMRNARPSWIAPIIAISLAILLSCTAAAHAQDYPSRPLKLIVPYPAGGTTDILPRIMQEWLSRKWGQPVVIDNRSGAAGNLGAEAAFKAEPDGYTILVTAPSPMTVNQSLYPKLNFEPSEFVPVSILATIPTGLIVSPRVPANTVAEFIAYARANPGKINVATQGTGTTSHLTSEWFQMVTGTKFVSVPYRGSALALPAMIAGDVDIMFDNLGTSLQLVKEGRLKMLAVATDKRMADMPDMPTLAETLPSFSSSTWVGVFLPPKTPARIAERLNADFNGGLKIADIARRFRDNGCEPLGTTPAATMAFVRGEAERWGTVIKAAGIRLE
jgi:tripartite-type tricarboxylate transporter receptor subunit TctC